MGIIKMLINLVTKVQSFKLLNLLIVFICSFTINAQVATQVQINEVTNEVEKFKANWSQEMAPDAKFGIIQLAELLNLEYPGLEKVKIAVSKENWVDAERELLIYYRNKLKRRKPEVVELTSIEKEASESALSHFYRGNKDAHPLIFRGANIDWVSPAFHNGKEIKDKEWQFIFQRLYWWDALAKAYQLTNDDRYFYEWQYEMVDFAEDILPVSDDAPWFVRRGMETFYRCIRLTNVLPYFIDHENFDTKTLLYFLTSFHLQAEHIRTVYSEDGNHLLGELTTVLQNGANFPEFKKATEWTEEALRIIPERMFVDIYPDGMNNELVFNYHSFYMELFSDAYLLFKEYDYLDKIPTEFYERLVKMAEVYTYHIFPDYSISQFGDSKKPVDASKIFNNLVSRYAPDLPYFDFISSKGEIGTPPPKTTVAYPISGFYAFRTNWTEDAIFMSMKNNPNYSWHSQLDNQSFELYAYGRNFMIDSGSYMYNSDDPIEMGWRNWFRSSKVHQTLTLDNEDMKIASKHIFWKHSDDLTCLVNENKSYDNLNHRRITLFIDNKYFLIYDEALGDAAGDVRIHFQLSPMDFKANEKELKISSSNKTGPSIIVKNFGLDKATSLEMEEGWISYKPNRKEKRPAWSYKVNKLKEQKSIDFLTAIIPYRENQEPIKVESDLKKTSKGMEFYLKVGNDKYEILLNIKENISEIKKK